MENDYGCVTSSYKDYACCTNQPIVACPTSVELLNSLRWELYNRFSAYVLTAEQMKQNGYPMECPTNPGKAVFKDSGRRHRLLSSPNDRFCSRCNDKYTVLEDGRYQSETCCYYHSGKRQRIGQIGNVGAYTCCGDPGIRKGCTVTQRHVGSYEYVDKVEFVKTCDKRKNPTHLIVALDCEMCYTIQGLEVTRVSLVDECGVAIYDTFVMPENPIIDYNTKYSGITPYNLKGVKTTLADVQAFFLENISSRTIIIGHSLESDFKALHLIHETVIDTSVVFAPDERKRCKLSLQTLASDRLQKCIQQGTCGHDSVEDARTCMELIMSKLQEDNPIYMTAQQETFGTPLEHQTSNWQCSPSPNNSGGFSYHSVPPNFYYDYGKQAYVCNQA